MNVERYLYHITLGMNSNIPVHKLLEMLLKDQSSQNINWWNVAQSILDRNSLEAIYQSKIRGFSSAYLAGSSWYVGPSLMDYIDSRPINNGILCSLMYLSRNYDCLSKNTT